MIDIIEPIPKIPETLRQAALQQNVIPFIGAGVSQLSGCPSWSEFADATLNYFVQKGKLSHAQLDQISSLSSRIKLSLALELEERHNLPIKFEDLLKPSTEKRKFGDGVYTNLSKLSETFVTTNYDEWLAQNLPASLSSGGTSSSILPDIIRQPFYQYTDITVENLIVPNAVFHLHGSVRDRNSMILATIQYLERYSSHRVDINGIEENPFLTFLDTLFRLKNVLFIGYGLNELEILEYVFQKGIKGRPNNNEEPQHYVLHGFFSHEIEIARSLERYFRQFGIGLLPFSRDEHGWDQLAYVIEYIAQEIPPGQDLALTKRHEMEALLS